MRGLVSSNLGSLGRIHQVHRLSFLVFVVYICVSIRVRSCVSLELAGVRLM